MYFRDELLKDLAADFGIDDPPDYEVVRVLDDHEWQSVQLQCLTEAGFAVSSTQDGEGIAYPEIADPALVQSLFEAMYRCEAQYPTDAKYLEPLTQAQLERLYAYATQELVGCLRDHGYPTSVEPPSLTVYVQDEGAWSPYQELIDSVDPTKIGELRRACPDLPDDLYE